MEIAVNEQKATGWRRVVLSAMERRGWSDSDLARAIGERQRSVWDWLHGGRTPHEAHRIFAKMSLALGIPFAELAEAEGILSSPSEADALSVEQRRIALAASDPAKCGYLASALDALERFLAASTPPRPRSHRPPKLPEA